MNFTLRQIRYFVTIAETLSVSKAARDLYLSQSALTNALSELEASLGVLLFIRSHKGVTLTHEGHQFLISSRRILASVADAAQGLTAGTTQDKGTLVIGVTSLVAGYYLSEPLSRFTQHFPGVKVTLIEDEQAYLENQLVNGEIDVAIFMLQQMHEPDAFEMETLTRSPLKVWLPVNHPLFKQADISLLELAKEPLITLTANRIDHIIGQTWRRYNKTARSFLETESVEAVRNLVGASLGIAILPEFAYRPWTLDMQRVETRNIREEIPSIDIGLVWRRGSHLNWATSEFIDLARDQSRSKQHTGI
jgi:DNA-binding transcriptional LysR family regulator